MYGLRNFKAQIVDERGNPVTSGISVSVAAATIYADAYQTAKTNPITTVTNGEISFWLASTSVDVIVNYTDGGIAAKITLTPTGEKQIIIPTFASPMSTTKNGRSPAEKWSFSW